MKKEKTKKIVSSILLILILKFGLKEGTKIINNLNTLKKGINNYSSSLNDIIKNYQLMNEETSDLLLANYLLLSDDEAENLENSYSLNTIIDNYLLIDQNKEFESYLQQVINFLNNEYNFNQALKKEIDNFFNNYNIDYHQQYFDEFTAFIFEKQPIKGIYYRQLDSKTKRNCLEIYSALAKQIQEKKLTKKL